ncbi:hypothetical protein [Syntrophomonas wolfei]|jgi:acyl-CoA hydrolase|uniref:hypothetical protein n=1 Tax=Syntrophomonas wolfei TaxID=863 RepID=UPI000774C75B|nr:hypothetical protein [Syntrophomonas wolfei]
MELKIALNYLKDYDRKFTFADEAVKCIKEGSIVRYAFGVCHTNELDFALARRRDKLNNVYILYDPDAYQYAAMISNSKKNISTLYHINGRCGNKKIFHLSIVY